MQIAVVSLFPEMVRTVAEHGVVGRAMERQLAALRVEDPREYATDTHRTVDDRPYGGGPGMVLKYQPAAAAIRAARGASPEGSPVIYLSPSGRVFDQDEASRLSALPGMILLAGRYEGVDERLIEEEVDEELSIGDFVLSGGEIAAMAVIDAVVRLLPGVLGDEDSAAQDSFRGAARLSPLHATRGNRGSQRAGGFAVRRSCAHCALALQAGPGSQFSAAPGPGGKVATGPRAAGTARRVPERTG
jgi:tRNA (guanine37-N1)-methyltransferase